MSKLMQAIDATSSARTENGMAAHNTTGQYTLDLFGKIGSARHADLTQTFLNAYIENADVATRILLWARDARGGSGERETFRKLFALLIKEDVEQAAKVLAKVPELGRWDDVLVAMGTKLESQAVEMIRDALAADNGLCAKWMPRKGEVASKLRVKLGFSPKFYRKRLVELTKVVETQMCNKQWDAITFEHVPSVAMSRYAKAFRRNSKTFATYIDKVDSGEAKMNMSVAFPHDVVRALTYGGKAKDADVMWKNLPDLLADSTERFIPVVDVSGSMGSLVSGSITAMDISIGLGIYCAQRNRSVFNNQVITFSEKPSMVRIPSNLSDAVNTVRRMEWGMNTNLEAVFKMILDAAKKGNLTQDDLPTKVLIVSDMQFDSCIKEPSNTAYTMIRRQYEEAGFEMPTVVFWNVCARATTVPITIDEHNTALVSGFSPSILKSLMKGVLNPVQTMLDTVMVDRYAV